MPPVLLLCRVRSVVVGGIIGSSLGRIGGDGAILMVPLLLYLLGYHEVDVVLDTTALAVALTAHANLIPHGHAETLRWHPSLAHSARC